MKRILTQTSVVIAVSMAFAGAAFAAEPEGKVLAELAFKGLDQNADGFATMEEYQSHAEDVFVSMDSNDNNSLTWDEFGSWGFGMSNIAESTGREQAYETARRTVFDLWDRSFDWEVSPEEQRRGVTADFISADENRDGRLSKDEYTKFSIVNITLRSALRRPYQ